MITEETIVQYLHSLGKDRSALLEEMRLFAEAEHVPVIRREMESLMEVLLEMKRPERILEIGTGIAFSAIFMAQSCPDIREIVTIENDPERIRLAASYIRRYEEGTDQAKISLVEADAAEAIRAMEGTFDLIFLDGPKGQYPVMLPELLRLLKNGGILLSDNVLQEGDVVRPRYLLSRRERTIHERMREFLWTITHEEQLVTTVLPLGDGAAVSVKREER